MFFSPLRIALISEHASPLAALGGTDAGGQNVYVAQVARAHSAIVIGDVIPGHTGKGADFRLAERDYADYPGLYHMVQIDPADWALLPPVPAGHDSVNLSPAIVEALQRKHYIVGMLSSRIFYQPGVKDSDWSATDIVQGTDGVNRRWVYLHYFKQGQPTLNWLDPSFAAARLVIGDALHDMSVLGDGAVGDIEAHLDEDPHAPAAVFGRLVVRATQKHAHVALDGGVPRRH